MNVQSKFRTFQTSTADARQAAREFYAGVVQPDMELVVFFCSSEYDLEALADELGHLFAGIQAVGCTTAGEIGPAGYLQHSLSGASFPDGSCKVVTGLLEGLQQFDITRGYAFAQTLLQKLEGKVPEANSNNSFAFMLIDGLSMREELVAYTLHLALDKLPLVGGSAGDDMKFTGTQVYYDGRFHSDSAILTLITTSLPFKIFRTQHFVRTDKRLVVTEADTAKRIVKEIDGMPAAEAYARMLGVDVNDLTPKLYASWPVVVMIDGTDYVRSIQKVNPDGSMSFFCAIEEGLVLRVAYGINLEKDLERTFDESSKEIGLPQLVIGFDCILRALEIDQMGIRDCIGEIFRDHNTIGFSTYGEQFHGIHVNQTLTGIIIGTAQEVDNV
ncbi:MAG: nitric oxide-sensing protein NosP [Smithella sp.]